MIVQPIVHSQEIINLSLFLSLSESRAANGG